MPVYYQTKEFDPVEAESQANEARTLIGQLDDADLGALLPLDRRFLISRRQFITREDLPHRINAAILRLIRSFVSQYGGNPK